ncbi:hypothetical protein [Portibacter marinus]|uniref:hypothetical protein n=1 Tax=Portibacter marinus TaxID=2898660 RepID=UPI001F21863F|nr:hypothetical protein [Portibacter marinus]
MIGCHEQDHKLLKNQRWEIVERWTEDIRKERADLEIEGDVYSTLEYEFESKDESTELIEFQQSKYRKIAVNSDFNKILDVPIIRSKSYQFNKSGQLIKQIEFRDHKNYPNLSVDQYYYDGNGNLIEIRYLDSDEKVVQQKQFRYDSNDRIIELVEHDNEKSISSKSIISYFDDYLKVHDIIIQNNDTLTTYTSNFNRFGQLIEDSPMIKNSFDKAGHLIKTEFYDLDGILIDYKTFEFDSLDNKVEESSYDSLGNLVNSKFFIFDREGELILDIIVDRDYTILNNYKDKNEYRNFLHIPNKSDRNRYGTWTFKDNFGNDTKIVRYSEIGEGLYKDEVKRTEIQYDDKGNWIRKEIYDNDSLTTIKIRQLTYF